jgi:hypothetical protein
VDLTAFRVRHPWRRHAIGVQHRVIIDTTFGMNWKAVLSEDSANSRAGIAYKKIYYLVRLDIA